MSNTVPRSITENIRQFCGTISAEVPVFVRSIPVPGAKLSYCFDNVARKIERNGGTMAVGWAIWNIAGLYIEAEHHGVWLNKAGKMIDVSPQFGNAAQILFLPDSVANYSPTSPRVNRFQPDSNNLHAVEFARLAQERADLLNKYHVGGPGAVVLLLPDQMQLDTITGRLQELQTMHFQPRH